MAITNSLTKPTVEDPEIDDSRKLQSIRPETPFGEMALALSGGGFRAASFSLGAISYLNRAYIETDNEKRCLLHNVTFITSTSGGTLASTYYSASIFKPGFSFAKFYGDMKNFLDGDGLLEEVCAILNDPKCWNEKGTLETTEHGKKKTVAVEKSQNIINAFAKAYDKMLFQDPQNPNANLFDVYFNRDTNPHLKGVCFNATELNNGISFRFQTNGQDDSIRTVGNYYLSFNDAGIARKLRLGDIAATSSCFPSGFEPMIYPNDYIHPGLTDVNKMLDAITYKNNNPLNLPNIDKQPFCMVDGGVVDNQGLYSMMMEDTFRAQHHPKKQFDLMMVCDVSSYFVNGYITPPQTTAWYKYFTIDRLRKLMPVGVIVFLASLALALFIDGIGRRVGLFFVLTSGLYSAFYFWSMLAFNKFEKGLAKSFGSVIDKFIGIFFKIKFYRFQQMLQTRLNSTLLITIDLFLKQIRRQYFSDFYGMPAYKNRVLSCYIYEFSAQHAGTRTANLDGKDKKWWHKVSDNLTPTAEMQTIATNATAVPTTLWFGDGVQVQRDDVIACGQFTMCYCLLKHIYRLELLDAKWQTDVPLQDLKARLLADWEAFKKLPRFMVEKGE